MGRSALIAEGCIMRDLAIATLLGAEEWGMLPIPEHVINMFSFMAQELRDQIMAELGKKNLEPWRRNGGTSACIETEYEGRQLESGIIESRTTAEIRGLE